HRLRGGGGGDRGGVRGLAERSGDRHRDGADEPQHAGGLRRAAVDLRAGPGTLRSRRSRRAAVRAVGGHDVRGETTMNRLVATLLLVFALLAVLFGGTMHAQGLQKITFALNWFPVGDHAAYWVALDKGYYRARGLDVEMQNSKGSGDSIAKVDT